MLKDVREYISYPLCYILNLSVTTATVPITWKCAKIIPVHKSGSYDQPENFRPISVLPILSKLLENLQANGVQNKELAWFTDYLFGREQYVQLGVNKSINQTIFSGVPQGSILGPLLFLVFYNDLVDIGIASRVIKYVDDNCLLFGERYRNYREYAIAGHGINC